METAPEIQDLDRAINLLEDYTTRTKSVYRELSKDKRQRMNSVITLAITLIIIIFVAMAISLNFSNIRGTGSFIDLLFVIVGTVISGILFINFRNIRNKDLSFFQREDLRINSKQLKSLISLLSQYFEHNRNILSDLRKFEINLRLLEAEDILNEITKRYPEFFDKTIEEEKGIYHRI